MDKKQIRNALYYNRQTFNGQKFRQFIALMEVKGYDTQTIRDACYMAAESGSFSR